MCGGTPLGESAQGADCRGRRVDPRIQPLLCEPPDLDVTGQGRFLVGAYTGCGPICRR